MSSQSSSSYLVPDAKAIFQAAVKRVQAPELISTSNLSTWAPESLSAYNSLRVVGMGKAALAMAGVVEQHLQDWDLTGCAVVPKGYPESYPDAFPTPSSIDVIEGGHPLPTEGSLRGARQILEHAEAVSTNELLLVLVSGGGTALSTLPAGDLQLDDLQTTYHQMLRGGINVHQMNVVRKHLTQVGGGQLAECAYPGHVGALFVSDVVGDDLSIIASGPTVPDSSTYENAVRVLQQNQLWEDVPAPIQHHLTEGVQGKQAETPVPGAECFEWTTNSLLGTNRTALRAAQEEAEARGYKVRHVEAEVEGEARNVGQEHARVMLEVDPDRPTCWLWGGETTVTVTGDGTGGRNQEVALGAALELGELKDPAVFLSGGTDGIDGPTDAAGAWATPRTADAAQASGCDPEIHLQDNDAYPLFDVLDQLLRTGPTHTNVMDVHVGLADSE